MQPLRVERESAAPEAIAGRVLCHDLRSEDGRVALAKGRLLDAEDAARVFALPWRELHLVALNDRDVHEQVAGRRIAELAAGDGVDVREPQAGHWPLAATRRGMLAVDATRLRQVNALDGPCVYTLFDGQVVDAGDVVAHAKIIPFAVTTDVLRDVELIAGNGLVGVRAFVPHRIGAVVYESIGERAIERFREAVGEKLAWFGSTLRVAGSTPPSPDAIARALEQARRAGAQIVLAAGTKAMDMLDPMFAALERIGARMEQHGVPAHPGSLLWLAMWDGVPIVGMPTCGLFAQATIFDLVIARMLTGEVLSRAELAALGHGGLLSREMAFRFPAYRRAGTRGAVE